jgi:coenzyme F420-reducing hydrogenase delta subunit
LIYLLANKCEEGRMGWEERVWCQRERVMCCEVSARTGQGVGEAVNEIVSALVEVRPRLEKEKMTMALRENAVEPEKGCCK